MGFGLVKRAAEEGALAPVLTPSTLADLKLFCSSPLQERQTLGIGGRIKRCPGLALLAIIERCLSLSLRLVIPGKVDQTLYEARRSTAIGACVVTSHCCTSLDWKALLQIQAETDSGRGRLLDDETVQQSSSPKIHVMLNPSHAFPV